MITIRHTSFLVVALLPCVLGWSFEEGVAPTIHPDWKSVPLGPAQEKGLQWLISVQGEDGGWGQDGGRSSVARQGITLESSGNDVANTSIAALALLRSGANGGRAYGAALDKAVRFVLNHVEEAPADGLAITTRTGTQIQRKLGPYIDTFLAALLLSEVDGQMADASSQKRVRAALNKCVAKIEKNQLADGSWNVRGGWAPILGTSMASRGLYLAAAKGVRVEPKVLAKVEQYTKNTALASRSVYEAGGSTGRGVGGVAETVGVAGGVTGGVAGGVIGGVPAAAGVPLYQGAQALEQLSRTSSDREKNYKEIDTITTAVKDKRFVSGYGSMGGEEYFSYLNISDSLQRMGGRDWTEWNQKIKTHLVKLQNQDGTWAGHHCITGRVTCSSSAILTLSAERSSRRIS
jgi:hypothetical protein